MNTIIRKSDFIKIISTSIENKVKFIKKDGSVRIMRFTTNLEKIPAKFHIKKSINKRTVSTPTSIIHVFDLDKNGWRSIPLNRLQWLENGKGNNKITYQVKLKDII